LTRAIDLKPDAWMYHDLRSVVGLEAVGADLCLEDAMLVERVFGVRTARTLHVRAFLTRNSSPDRADQPWEACLERGGEQHQALNNRGELLLKFGELDEDAALLSCAIRATPSG